ncbi:MAG TPA: SRPBCC domain-containing protein [Puia sp.]|nr:SRPBCC domain-containing protein [Puia sp.]
MEQKTKITAESGKQEVVITREFELPVELLFKAHIESDIVEKWMGTKVLQLDGKKQGGYQFETTNPEGQVVFKANGVIHDFAANRKITRTFEMENTPFGVQLEFYEFEELSADTSKLHMHVLFESVEQRDQVLQIGFSWGLNMAHDRLQDVVKKLK